MLSRAMHETPEAGTGERCGFPLWLCGQLPNENLNLNDKLIVHLTLLKRLNASH